MGYIDRKAIIESYSNPHYAPLYKDIKAIVFLGTPHQGAELARILTAILSVSFSSSHFVKQLVPDSDAIKSINNSFSHRANSLKLVTYYETENTRLYMVMGIRHLI